MKLRTLCRACLHGVQAIVETLPAVRRLRGLPSLPSPPLPAPRSAPPLFPPPLVVPLVPPLDSPAYLFEEEAEESSGWVEGAKDRNADMVRFQEQYSVLAI